jgi:hypothetical protein
LGDFGWVNIPNCAPRRMSARLQAEMLQIADRRLQLLTPSSGIGVHLAPNAVPYKQHTWWLNTYWAAEDEGSARVPWSRPEVWRLALTNLNLTTRLSDWHDLERFEIEEDDLPLVSMGGHLENIAQASGARDRTLSFVMGTCRFIGRSGYNLILEMEGEVLPDLVPSDDDLCGDFSLRVELPFHAVKVAVPLNAADPLATAAGIARREIGLSAYARYDVRVFDPTVPTWKPVDNSHHMVWLETPWRG